MTSSLSYILDRFTATLSDGCWSWQGPGTRYGNAPAVIDGRHTIRVAHRVLYEAVMGPLDPALTLDHLCRNTKCVRPSHLEPVSLRENLLRGQTAAASKAAQTHCLRGHAFDDTNTYKAPNGTRRCRRCQAATVAAYRARRAHQL